MTCVDVCPFSLLFSHISSVVILILFILLETKVWRLEKVDGIKFVWMESMRMFISMNSTFSFLYVDRNLQNTLQWTAQCSVFNFTRNVVLSIYECSRFDSFESNVYRLKFVNLLHCCFTWISIFPKVLLSISYLCEFLLMSFVMILMEYQH